MAGLAVAGGSLRARVRAGGALGSLLVRGLRERAQPLGLRSVSTSSSSSSSTSGADKEGDAAGMTHFGYQAVRSEEKQRLVKDVFDSVASNYDLMNDVMSAGVHRLWKDHFVGKLGPVPGMRVLDMAGGTGDIAFRMVQEASSNAPVAVEAGQEPEPLAVTVCDINEMMLEQGQQRAAKEGFDTGLTWQPANAESVPFEDATFDAYTIAFGIRNVTNIDAALREAHRVLKPGGRFMCLEFSQVTHPALRTIYDEYSFRAIPVFGEFVTGDRESYQYLVESIRRFPAQHQFERMIEDAGFRFVAHENLTLGVAAIHSGFKLP